jgi:glycosyltransferase involved in cell wall biosynthesis
MPCRDAVEHLPQAIRSLSLQTFRDFEVIVVNDGSRDDTGTELERWAARDSRVRVTHQDRNGLAEALRSGSELCRGELLARADADDVVHARRFAEQMHLMDSRPDVTASGTYVRYFPWKDIGVGARRYQRWLNGLSESEGLARDIFVECPIAHPTLMVRRDVFEQVGGYRANGWPEDYDLILRLHNSGARLANLPRIRHFWRERENRASRIDPRYSAASFRHCKIHHLRQGVLKDRDAVSIWGAGRVGKDFARALADQGVRVIRFFDIDPRKIGQEIYGVPVHRVGEVSRFREDYLLVIVGAPGARELIREQLGSEGFQEPRDFRCVA